MSVSSGLSPTLLCRFIHFKLKLFLDLLPFSYLAEMWQVVLGAAIAAGSTGLVAKRFFNPFSPHPRLLPEDHGEKEHDPVTAPVGIGFLNSPCEKTNGVFRFSSSGSAGSGSGSSPGFRKSSGVTCKVKVRGLMKQKKKKNNGGGSEIEKRSGTVCLKKPRTLGADSASKRGVSYYNNNQGLRFLETLMIYLVVISGFITCMT